MIFYLLLCNILFIPIISCSNVTVSKSEIANKTASDTQRANLANGTTGPLPIEGGSISYPETLIMALPEVKHAIPNTNEVSKNKVVARKGVVYPGNNTKSQETSVSSNEKYTIHPSTTGNQSTTNIQLTSTTITPSGKNSTVDKVSKDSEITNKSVTIKKPLILNSDVLENQTVKSSPETLVETQIPNKKIKSYVTNATNHPGMVMPIVITILLVPMFAVLGYMALRRGQEAWKNRHYKRMDFLLDGMYND